MRNFLRARRGHGAETDTRRTALSVWASIWIVVASISTISAMTTTGPAAAPRCGCATAGSGPIDWTIEYLECILLRMLGLRCPHDDETDPQAGQLSVTVPTTDPGA